MSLWKEFEVLYTQAYWQCSRTIYSSVSSESSHNTHQSLLLKGSGWADNEHTFIGAIQIHHQSLFSFLCSGAWHFKSTCKIFFLNCNIFCRNTCLGDISHSLLLAVAFSTIKHLMCVIIYSFMVINLPDLVMTVKRGRSYNG